MTITLPLWALAAFAVGGALMVSAATTLIGRSAATQRTPDPRHKSGTRPEEPRTKVVVGRGRAPKCPPAPAAQDPRGYDTAAHKENR